MKKLICSLAVLLGLSGLYQANAQAHLNFGIKANANMSNYIIKNVPRGDSDMNIGASAGALFNIEFGRGAFALQPEIMLNYYSSKLKKAADGSVGVTKSKLNYFGLEIPVYAVGQIQRRNGSKWYLGVGPYVSCGLSLKDKTGNKNLYKNDMMRRFDFGGAAMLGYEFPFGMQINAGYKLAFTDSVNKGVGKMRNQSISLGLAWAF